MEQKVSWRNFLTETGLESINCIKTVCTVRKYHIMILDHAQFVMSKMLILLKQLSWGKKIDPKPTKQFITYPKILVFHKLLFIGLYTRICLYPLFASFTASQ